jgi:hypothetical protein
MDNNINNNFKSNIYNIITNFFINLNKDDLDYLNKYVLYLIDILIKSYDIINYEQHFLKNNGMDIKSLVLQLIPFVKNYNFFNLDQILYNDNKKFIDKKILEI